MSTDTTVALAIAQKLRHVFSDEGTFLAIPRSPAVFSAGELGNLLQVATTPEALVIQETWDRIVNSIPNDGYAVAYEDRRLWEELREVLDSPVKFAGDSDRRNPEDEQLYEQALSFLYVNDPVTLTKTALSAAQQKYREYRDVWFEMRQRYNLRRAEIELSSDPDVKSSWRQAEQPLYESKLAEIESDWEILGFRRRVEDAQDALRRRGTRTPSRQWREWDAMFRPFDVRSGLTGGRFVPTAFTPANFFDTDWLLMKLDDREAEKLIAEAPKELRQCFGISEDRKVELNSDIQQIQFEFCSASVVRGWFSPELVRARFWQFAQTDVVKVLSDGGMPPRGDLPAYVAAVVFVRNLKVTRRAAPTASSTDSRTKPVAMRDFLAWESGTFVRERFLVRSSPLSGEAAISSDKRKELQRSMAMAGFARNTAIRNKYFADDQTRQLASLRLTPRLKMPKPVLPGQPATTPHPTSPGSAANGTITTTSLDQGEMGILAFICRAFGRSPDPDPQLVWS